MNILQLIEKKKEGRAFSEEEVSWLVSSYVDGTIPDYQMSALLMAIYFKGMDPDETLALTQAMVDSGHVLSLDGIEGTCVDKHSTGGVGDTTSLVLGPVLAACGLVVAKMSGRGLGHTGGTLDKMEAIPGLSCEMTEEAFIDQSNEIGLVISGQSQEVTPADKKIYALRDATGTVDSIPLIASSIMSKKIAIENDVLVLDVKCGQGAFMKTLDDAKDLARVLVEIGQGAGRKLAALVTSMDQPLGLAIGNSLEVIEAIESLKGQGPQDLMDLVEALAAKALVLAGRDSEDEARAMVRGVIEDGSALDKFRAMVKAQGGDPGVVEDYSLLPQAAQSLEVKADRPGYLKTLPALALGDLARSLGAGRLSLDDELDLGAGILLGVKLGDRIEEGQVLATLYSSKPGALEEASKTFVDLIEITDQALDAPDLILGEVSP